MKHYRITALLLAALMVVCSPTSAYAQIDGGISEQQAVISENSIEIPSETVSENTTPTEIPEGASEETPEEIQTETPEEIPAEAPKESVSENELTEETVSDNTISDNSLSDNSLSDEGKRPVIEMQLSAQMMQAKVELQGTSELMGKMISGVDYESNEAVFTATSKNYAQKVATGYGAELASFAEGVGVIRFEEDAKEIIEMAEDEDVKLPAVYPNYRYYSMEDEAVSVQSFSVNDPYISSQTYLDVIDANDAWNVTQGSGVTVAVVDSGINKSHEDFAGKIAGAYTTYVGNFGGSGYNGALDNHGHGSNVAGIIGAAGNNKKGITGVAYKAKLVSVKALESDPITKRSGGSTESVIKAINKAAASGARVMNMSLGAPYYDALMEAAINNAVNKGIVVVVAAGNDSVALTKTKPTASQSTNYYSPACFDNVITVSALTANGLQKASFSNYGNGIIDIAAPGVGNLGAGNKSKNHYISMDGTSQASPIVAGVAALILSANPQLLKTKDASTVNTVKEILKSSATNLNNTSYFGAGCVNAAKAVGGATPTVSVPEFYCNGVKLENNATVQAGKAITISATATVNGRSATPTIYYTLDGKLPTVKSTQGTSFSIAASGVKTLKAIAVYNGKVSAIKTLKIKLNAPAQSVTVTSKTGVYVLGEKKSLQMAVAVLPAYTTNKKVTWSLSAADAEYASVNAKGVLTAKGLNGSAYRDVTVTATAQDGSAKVGSVKVRIYPLTTKMVVAEKKKTLVVPNTYKMPVAVTPSNAAPLTYVSSKPAVATVNPTTGVITAVGTGTTTITAKAVDGSGKSIAMPVTVTSPVKSVTVTSKTNLYSIAAGKSVQMVGTVNQGAGNKKVTWSVNVPKTVAQINTAGALIAAKTVTTKTDVTVTAASAENPSIKGTKVISIYPATTTVTLNATAKTLATTARGALTKGFQLTANSIPAGTLKSYTYTSSNAKVATVTASGYVTAEKAGTATITVKATDGSGKFARCVVKVVEPVTAITITSKTGYPVVGTKRTIQLTAATNSNASIRAVTWSVKSGNNVVKIDAAGKVTGLTTGTAVVTAKAKDGTNISKDYTVEVRTPIAKLCFINSRGALTSSGIYYVKKGNSTSDPFFYPYILDSTNTEVSDYDIMAVTNSNGNAVQIVYNGGRYYICGVNKGTSKIAYTTNDGVKKTATLTIKVI